MPPEVIKHDQIQKCIKALRAGQLVAIPTETVYGLAGDAFNPAAVLKIFSTKKRPLFDPLILHTYADKPSLTDLVSKNLVHSSVLRSPLKGCIDKLLNLLSPGPLSLILPKADQVLDLITSGLPNVAIRYPTHSLAQELLKTSGLTLAAPSANRFGRISPTMAEHVFSEFKETDLLILDGGASQIGLESTVVMVDWIQPALIILRPGAIGKLQLEKASGLKVVEKQANPTHLGAKASPGLLLSHYAPLKPLTLFDEATQLPPTFNPLKSGILLFSDSSLPVRCRIQKTLSPSGDINEACQNLFNYLRALDQSQADVLYAQNILPFFKSGPSEGLTLALAAQDRLNRASSK